MSKLEELQNLAKLPDLCYALIACHAPGERIVILKKGQCGYFCTDFDSPTSTLAIARQVVDMLNDRLGITEAQKLAMVAGSMAGFHVPAANPDHYTPKLH